MQEVYNDGSLGLIKTAETLEKLLPDIKKALACSTVKFVKVFNNKKKVGIKEVLKDLTELVTEDEEKAKSPFRTFSKKRR